MQKSWLSGLLILTFSPITLGQDTSDALPTISIENRQHQTKSAAQLKDEAMQTQVLSEKDIERKQAANLSQAIQNEPGIQISTECSICGAKRVTMNGMKNMSRSARSHDPCQTTINPHRATHLYPFHQLLATTEY
jgi:outer membrane cobalamin receptor